MVMRGTPGRCVDGIRRRRASRTVAPLLSASLLCAAACLLPAGCDGSSTATPVLDLDQLWPNPDGDVVSIYVYENVPELDHSFLLECYHDRYGAVPPWQDEIADMSENMGEIWLHRALLSHPWRVLDPEQADLFYVPIYPVLSMKLEDDRLGPWIRKSDADINKRRCQGSTHSERLNAAVRYLRWSSPFFNRFGGADHVVVCAWWNCREAFGAWHRMLLRRVVVGINEKIYDWARWGCGAERMVTVPYTASSALTTTDLLGGLSPEDRDIPFFFVGTSRNRQERENLKVVKTLSQESVIEEGGNEEHWGFNADQYASHISRSRFCFCPRGDTESSRRLFDAVAAGCIPVMTEKSRRVMPYLGVGLDYSKLAIVADKHAFNTPEGVLAIAKDLLDRSDEELADLRSGLRAAMGTILYGVTKGPDFSDMHPFLGTATKFLQASHALAGGGGGGGGEKMWNCPETGMWESRLAARTNTHIPPDESTVGLFLSESETIVNKDHSLLFCAAPNAGSLQFRMLAKRMQGVSHWNVTNDRSLLFDRAASELELLDVADGPLMKSVYHDNGSGWIKVSVARDPVTRLLSAYLDIVRTWRAGWHEYEQQKRSGRRQRRSLRQQEGGFEGNGRQGRSGGLLAGSGSEWSLLDAILETRLTRSRPVATSRGEGEGEEADTPSSSSSSSSRGNDIFHGARDDANSGVVGGANDAAAGGGNEGRNVSGLEGEVSEQRGGRSSVGGGVGVERRRLEVDGGEYHRAAENSHHHLDAGHRRQQQQQQRRRQRMTAGEEDQKPGSETGTEEGGWWPFAWKGSTNSTTVDVADIPTFKELVEALKGGDVYSAPAAFRPTSSLCGQNFTQFDAIIPFERLQKTSVEVIKSLPGDLWESFGASGWGPEGKYAFMEFDYGAAQWGTAGGADDNAVQPQEGGDENPLPRRARDLFEEGSCAWTEHYGDMGILEAVAKIYKKDYNHHRWYKLDTWRARLQACLDKKRE